MSCTGFGKCTLDSLVDVSAFYITEEDGLVSGIHDREILDVFQILDGDTDFDPAGFSISKVVPAIRTFVDGVEGFREVGLDNLPSPCPGEVGKVALLLSVLVAVDRIERRKMDCGIGNKWIRVGLYTARAALRWRTAQFDSSKIWGSPAIIRG